MFSLKYIIAIIISMFCYFCNGLPQSEGLDSCRTKINKRYFLSFLTDTRDILTAPAHWNKNQWITTGVVIGTTSLIITQDAKIQKFAQDSRTIFFDNVTKYGIERWGGGKIYLNYSLISLGTFYIYGELFNNQRSKKVALLGLKAFLVTGAIIYIPKIMFGRHRPSADNPSNSYAWSGPSFSSQYLSLPSGHTTSVFALATIIASEYKEKPVIPVIAYSIASLTGISRIYDNAHWSSDVFIGAIFGYAMGKLIYNINNRVIQIKPVSTPEVSGIILTFPIH
jgi:membrane-associated phospholipid phosphatase